MATYQGILLTKSPYYITELGALGFTSDIEIRIWGGAMNSEPAITYNIIKQALSSTETSVLFEISKIIEASFNHLPNQQDLVGVAKTNALWVNVKSFQGTANIDKTWLALDGYSNFHDGVNYQPSDSVLISERILYHYEGLPIRFPVHVEGIAKANTVEFRLGTTVVSTSDYTALINSVNSYDKIQYPELSGQLPGAVDNVVIKNSIGTIIDTLTIEATTCSRYTPYVVSFINKFGANQELVFGLVSKERVTVTKQSYNRQTLEINAGVPSYNTGRHKYKGYNANVMESIKLNTNYIHESLNPTLEQLISSEAVWLTVDGVTLPVNVKTTNLDYKKSVNEGLINYTLEFDYAFNKRNNIY